MKSKKTQPCTSFQSYDKYKEAIKNITLFDDWLMNMLSNSDYTETELMEFKDYYENLLDYETNTINFIKFNQSNYA